MNGFKQLFLFLALGTIVPAAQGMQNTFSLDKTRMLFIAQKTKQVAQTFTNTALNQFYDGRKWITIGLGMSFAYAYGYPLYLYAKAYAKYYKNAFDTTRQAQVATDRATQEQIGLAHVIEHHPTTQHIDYQESGIKDHINQFIGPKPKNFQNAARNHTLRLIADRAHAQQELSRPIFVLGTPVNRLSVPLFFAQEILISILTSSIGSTCIKELPNSYVYILSKLLGLYRNIAKIRRAATRIVRPPINSTAYTLLNYYILTRNTLELGYSLDSIIFMRDLMRLTGLSLEQVFTQLREENGVENMASMVRQRLQDNATPA